MKENLITIRVGKGLEGVAEAKGQTFIEWFQDALDLASEVDQGNVYQKTGTEFRQINIREIKPFPEEPSSKKTQFINLDPELYQKIEHKTDSFRDWVLRVISLQLRTENLDLYFLKDGTYEKIVFSKEKRPGF